MFSGILFRRCHRTRVRAPHCCSGIRSEMHLRDAVLASLAALRRRARCESPRPRLGDNYTTHDACEGGTSTASPLELNAGMRRRGFPHMPMPHHRYTACLPTPCGPRSCTPALPRSTILPPAPTCPVPPAPLPCPPSHILPHEAPLLSTDTPCARSKVLLSALCTRPLRGQVVAAPVWKRSSTAFLCHTKDTSNRVPTFPDRTK